jgi:hypothetical protein
MLLTDSAGRKAVSKTIKINTAAKEVSMIGGRSGRRNSQIGTARASWGAWKLILDNRGGGSTIEVSPPIPVRIEWADSQGSVTASWLAAHFNF